MKRDFWSSLFGGILGAETPPEEEPDFRDTDPIRRSHIEISNLALRRHNPVILTDPVPADQLPTEPEAKPDYFEELATETVNHWTVDYPAAFPDHQRENLRLAIKRSLMIAYGEGRRDADRDAGRDQE